MNQNAKTSHKMFLIQNTFVVLFFFGLFCASHTNTIRAKRQISTDGNFKEATLDESEQAAERKAAENFTLLVKILKSLGADLKESVEYSEHELTENLLTEIKDVWRRLVENQRALANSGESAESLRTYMAHIRFIAKDRLCESPDETFFKDQCLPISTENRTEHCPENMGLFDGLDNKGYCDCLDFSRERTKSELRLIYSHETGSCYRQNTQGPCEYGQWFVLKNITQCEPVPEGCLTDGHHVYWSPEPLVQDKQCWEIWTQGPCEEGKLIHLAEDTENFKIYCSYLFSEQYIPSSLEYCPRGTYYKNGECRRRYSFYG